VREFVAVPVGVPDGNERPPRAPEHLTLRFLGEVPSAQNDWIVARLAEVARGTEPFRLRFEGVGAFPGRTRPRVIWVAVTDGTQAVVELARRVRVALAPAFGPDREAFVPHLTLFRVRSPSDRRAAEELLSGARPPPPPRDVTVRELLLQESDLRPDGAVHRTVAACRLGSGGAAPP
jgi:RNA 2',3'-cyclic 3'-phosphodiesterase